MSFIKSHKSKFLITGLLSAVLLLAGSCQNWMSNDDFMSKIENEVHDANAKEVNVYIRYANVKMGSTEPQGNTTMKVDVASEISAITSDDYGFVKWAAFSTNDFPANKQHSKLTFLNEQDYNTNYKTKELPSSVVSFSNPKSTATEVKIFSARSDIFIIPIVATRPSYVQSVPANADTQVVKNTSIRILFSKAIDEKTLYDEDGNVNFSITTGFAGMSGDSEDMKADDITDYFEPTLSESKKMLTLKLRDKEDGSGQLLLEPKQRITVTLLEGLCDLYGFAMNGNYTFSFVTGKNTDSLAPVIEVLYGGGTGAIEELFVSFLNEEIEGNATDAAKNAPKDINNEQYTDKLVAQRVFDKVNLYVKSTDIIASGDVEPDPAKDYNEDNVAYIGISASLYIDKNGKAITPDAKTTIAKKNYIYIAGQIDSNAEENPLFTEMIPLKDGGTIYTYDVSSLPDGLIKIDVWGIDMTGNSGGPNDAGSPYYTKHDNGYKSIFVVKDTTPINSIEEANKIDSNSAAAPYHWYNYSTLGTMKLYDTAANKIHDSGHIKLRSLDKNLWWNFSTTTTPDASHWSRIHDDNGVSVEYPFTDAKAPAKDGPVDITVFMRDDMGNLSAPVVLPHIMYDNTKPTVTLKSGKGDFVIASGENVGKETLHVSESKVINQVLKVEIGEANEDNAGSGIRRIELHVINKENNQEVAVPLAANFAVKYAPAGITNPTPTSEGIIPIKIVPVGTDPSMKDLDENKIRVFDVTADNKITNGTLFIYGISLDDAEGQYEVLVDLYDSALNKTPATAKTIMSRDTTDPVITKLQVMNVVSRKVYGQDEETWWVPYDRFEDTDNLSKVTLKITANESGSGLEKIELAENAEFTANTKLYVGEKLLEREKNYTLDVKNHTINLVDWYTPVLKNVNGGSHVITLENIKLNNINAPAGTTQGNKIKVEVKDFVGKTKAENTITYGDTSVTGTLVYADSIAPEIATLRIEDSQDDTADDIDNKAYDNAGYTNNQNVVLLLTLGNTETGNKGSGVDKIILTDNAAFTDDTQIYLNSNTTPLVKGADGDYEIATENGKPVVNFKKVFTEAETLKFTNVKIVSATPGVQTVKADVQDFAGIKSVESKNDSITLDKTAPVVESKDVYWDNLGTGVTAGAEKDMTVDTQSLRIDFTEATAGIKLIKFDISRQGQPAYGLPFANQDFKLSYKPANGTVTELVKDTDYEIVGTDQNFKQYIKLENTYTSGSFIFDNLTLSNSNVENTYFIDVVMLDAAENRVDCQQSIAIDSVAPVITEVLYIPGILHQKELTTSGGSPMLGGTEGTFWLDKELQGNRSGGNAPNNIPVYIKIEETNSGVKVIKFLDDVVLDSTKTKLYTAANKSDKNGVEVAADKYIVNATDNTITIKNTADCFKAATGTFTLLVKGVGFKHVDTTDYTSSSNNGASKNLISVTVKDVAMNESLSATTAEHPIYSDSRAPSAPTDLKLLDRGSSSQGFDASKTTITASEDYTNESIVNMTFKLSDCEKTGSGYHKFVLGGAKFTADTRVIVKTTSGGYTIIEDTDTSKFVLEENNTTLVLKSSDASAPENYVLRQAVDVTFTNIEFASTTNGLKTVSLTAYDLAGWNQNAASDSIYLDNAEPQLEKLFTANYTSSTTNNSVPSYYVPSVNVYPHPDGENAEGVPVEYTYNGVTKTVPTFYTATDYSSSRTRYQYNGQVSYSSSSLDLVFYHSIVLGIRAKDENGRLGGYGGDYSKSRGKTFLYYIEDSNFTKTKAEILAGTNPTSDINSKTYSTYTGSSATSEALWFGFDSDSSSKIKKYSAVIVDEAGNVSDIFHFAVVQDTAKPGTTDLNNRVLFERPDASSNIFRNSGVSASSTSELDFRAYNSSYAGMSTWSIRTKKFVTKKSGTDKYKILLKLGQNYNESNLITNMQGDDVDSTIASTKYSDLDGTASSAPIEQYAISTWYGEWPNTYASGSSRGYSYEYKPVVPYGTKFPSGQAMTNSSISDDLITMARSYFGYNSIFETYLRVYEPSTPYTSWHPYSHPQGSDGTKYTDYGNKITSYIDSNNNLVIELPAQSTPPVSVFLRDGCGNMSYVVCGLQTDNGTYTWYDDDDETQSNPHNVTYTYQSAPSFIIDDKLGWKQTTDGVNNEPIIMQNPYMTYVTSNIKVRWPYSNSSSGYYWNANSGNGSEGGVGEKFGFIKDHVKKATYYNPNISNTDQNVVTDQQFKLGLTLNYKETSSSTAYKEDVTFEEKDGPFGKTTSTTDYSTRALLYCTQSSDKPSYDTIVQSPLLSAVTQGGTYTGFRTDWTAIKISDTDPDGDTLLLDYPQPDYDDLGWVVYDEDNHEPIPHYMWYLYEDRVGNYEIGKVVNSSETDRAVLAGTKASSTVYDKWLFDGNKPVVTVKGTTKTPENILTDDDVRKLIPANNGYVPYLDEANKRIWISTNSPDSSIVKRNDTLITAPQGWGVTNKVDYNTSYIEERTWLPYLDLDVSNEITGIRAFAWSTSSTAPAYNKIMSSGNTQGDYETPNWYAGFGVESIKDIGSDYEYKYSSYKNPINAYLDYSSINATYKGKYSGTKINTIIPQYRISDTSDTTFYLHIMDWTGNIQTYQIGKDAQLKFRNDKKAPVIASTTDFSSETGKYYVNYENDKITLRIAGSSIKTGDVKVYFKNNSGNQLFYGDGTSAAGYAGFSFNQYFIDMSKNPYTFNVQSDDNGPYLVIPQEKYLSWKTGGTNSSGVENIYFFDNVGNTTGPVEIKCIYDETAPKVTAVTLSASNGKLADSEGAASLKEYTYEENADNSSSSKKPGETGFTCQTVYLNEAADGKITLSITHDADDFDHLEIHKWDGSDWSTSYTVASETDSTTSHYSFDANAQSGASNYYQILACDHSGNAGCQYICLVLDKAAPIISATPTIELGKGSINKITTGTGKNEVTTYYYTAGTTEEEMLKINFAAVDSGIGSVKNDFEYSLNGTYYYSLGEDPANAVIKVSSGDIQNIYLRDCLGNSTAYTPKFNYSYTKADGTTGTENNISTLTYYSASAPAVPYFNWNNVGDSVNTRKDSGKWANTYVTKLNSNNTDYVLIKDKTQTGLRMSFNVPLVNNSPSDKIIGYIAVDGNATPSTKPGAYSFSKLGSFSNDSKKVRITEDISQINKDTTFTRKYYAVDVVGNLSPALEISYTFDNPHKAKDITWIKTLDDVAQTDVKQAIQNDIQAGTFAFANFYDAPTIKNKKPGIIYFGDGFILVRCTLHEKADNNEKYVYENGVIKTDEDGNPLLNPDHYLDTPEKIEMFDVYFDTYNGNKINNGVSRGAATADSRVFKVYPSSQKDGADRYYCYIAFKPGTYDNNGVYQSPFDNNDEYDGSDIYVRIYGGSSTSDMYGDENFTTKDLHCNLGRLNTSAEKKQAGEEKGWKQDLTKPEVTGNYYSNSVITKYDITGTRVTVGDKQNDPGARWLTVAYADGFKIKIPKANVTDSVSGLASYRFDYSGNTSTTWTEMTENGNNYEFAVPADITTVHSNLTLYIKDKVGNIKSYTVADKDDYHYTWWIKNDILKSTSTITVDAPEDGWTQAAQDYTFKLTLPAGSIINSISATAGGAACTVKAVEFNGYNGTQPAVSELSQGWLNLDYINVTLDKINPSWTADKTVTITLNGNINVDVSANDFIVPKNSLSPDNVSVFNQNNEALPKTLNIHAATDEHTVVIQLPQGAAQAQVSNITADKATIKSTTWNNNIATLVLTGITYSWDEAKEVKLTITPSDNTVAAITKTVFNVNKRNLASGDIELKLLDGDALPESVEQDGEYKIKINVTDGKLLKDIGYATVTATTGVACSFDEATNIATLTVTRGEADIAVQLTITNGTTPYVKSVFTVKKAEQQSGGGDPDPADPNGIPDINSQLNFYSTLFKGVNPAITQGVSRVYSSTYTGSALLGSSYVENEVPEAAEIVESTKTSATAITATTVQTSVTTAIPATTETSVATPISTATEAVEPVVTEAIVNETKASQTPSAEQEVEVSLKTTQPESVMPAEEASSQKHSSAAIWVVLLAVLSSVCGIIFLKKRKVLA